MPQMSPLMWMPLYITFIWILMTFIMKIYFNKNIMNNLMKNKMFNKTENNWKW
nr:ATP synthase F0 subunit 8 [Nanhuaphasma hamicercum]